MIIRINEQEFKVWGDKIDRAVKISSEKFVAEMKRLNQSIVISENGIIKVIEAKDLK